jgi:hypothetical protein
MVLGQRLADERLEQERLPRYPERPQLLAAEELFDPMFEHLEDAESELAGGKHKRAAGG